MAFKDSYAMIRKWINNNHHVIIGVLDPDPTPEKKTGPGFGSQPIQKLDPDPSEVAG